MEWLSEYVVSLIPYSLPLMLVETLPRQFTTPMFWSEEDLRELEGTAIFGKHSNVVYETFYNFFFQTKLGEPRPREIITIS